MRISKNSMISVVTAAVLMTGFTGCSSDTNNMTESTSTSTTGTVNENEQSQYTAPIQGLVIDDLGTFIEGATVTIGNQTTTTDSAGQYYLENVDISAYVLNEIGDTNEQSGPSSDGCDDSCLLVSIVPPAGSDMNNVVVGVQPEMIHVADANDVDDDGQIYVVANSQSFTINSQVGTAMLTHKAANVKVFVGNFYNGAAVPEGTKVLAVYTGVDTGVSTGINGNFANYITGVNTVYGTTDANGMVQFDNLLTSSSYDLLVEGYSWNIAHDNTDVGPVDDSNTPEFFGFNTYTYQGYAASAFVANVGNLLVVPIQNGDEIAPRVASVSDQFGMYGVPVGNGQGSPLEDGARLMLQSSVTNTITINFTEAMVANNIADNVKVVSGNDFLAISNVELNGNQLTVTLVNDLADGQAFDILVFRDTNLVDLAGNELVFIGASADDEASQQTGLVNQNTELIALDTCTDGCRSAWLDYLSCTVGSRAIQFSLMAYKELRLDAEGASDIVQMELDTDVTRTASSVLSDLELYSNAFNNVDGSDADNDNILQLNNVSDNGSELSALRQALVPGASGVSVNVARVRFTANDATIYTISVPVTAGCTTTNANVVVTPGSCNGTISNGTNNTFIVNGFAVGDEIEILIDGVNHGNEVVITPSNDLCMAGTPATHTLLDNVAPTAVLQNSYIGGTIVDGIEQIVPFGEGGELTNIHAVDAGLGLPALYITPGLLDNLDAAGNNILGANNYIAGDETLEQELYIHNIADNNYTVSEKIYDATDWEVFKGTLSRDLGVAFSEDVDLTDVTPTFAGTSVIGYVEANNITVDDAGHTVARDLVAVSTDNVMTLANVESDEIMSFPGIKDMAGNAADNAHVKVLDGMPPMVTRAIFDGENVVMTFNEPIQLIDYNSASGFNGSEVRVIGAAPAQYDASTSPATWTLDTTETVLTISGSEFAGLDASDFLSIHNYDESALYALPAGDYKHARVQFHQIQDLNANSWATWCGLDWSAADASDPTYVDLECRRGRGGVKSPSFAMISEIGDFDVEVDNAGFNEDVNTTLQTVVWDFNQPIVTGALELFPAPGAVLTGAANAALINAWFEYVDGTTIPLATHLPTMTMSLDATAKKITLTFTGPVGGVMENDVIRNVGTQVFTSSIDPTQSESVTAAANGVAP